MGVFSDHAEEYLDAGLPVFPVDTRAKRPAVRNWKTAGFKATRAWAAKFPQADGLGLCMGERSRLVEVDVDMVGDAPLGVALEQFGESPITIRTASGKSKIWYRHNGEQRRIRPIAGVDIDVLGAGYTIAPPSWRADLGAAYHFLTGGLGDLERLPTIRADALERQAAASERPGQTVLRGERNNALFRYAMTQARHCDDLAALEDVCATWTGDMPEPLPAAEVTAVARSAWRYECAGRNFVGLRKPQVTENDRIMDELQDTPDAYFLLSVFRRYHARRDAFAISPTAMSNASNPPWHRSRIERARDVLLDRGFLRVVTAPDGRRRVAGQYCLTMPDSGNNHFTPPPLPPLPAGGPVS